MTQMHAYDAMIHPPGFEVEPGAFVTPFTQDEIAAMERYVYLAQELRRCRYFTEEERSLNVTMDKGVTTSFEMTRPDAGATRDMVGLLRQLFGDRERASFASMVTLLRSRADAGTQEGQKLLDVLKRYELIRQGVLDSWDVQPGGGEHDPHPPLTVFLDWLYGEYLHSDQAKAERIKELDAGVGLYAWQFHWIAERLAMLFTWFERVVRRTLDLQRQPSN